MKCRLCLKEKKLQNSHIIPEFFYKPLYDGLHRINVISTSSEEKSKYIQKGIREKLLCCDCERYFSGIEKYARGVFYGGVEIETAEERDRILLKSLDYAKLKLFQLSLLWRASVQPFSEARLGHHELKLREMLLTRDPGEAHQYGCILVGMLIEKNKLMGELISYLGPRYIDTHRCYRFIFGGCLWVFVVSKHSRNFPFREFFLSKEGKLVIRMRLAENTKLFRALAKDLRSRGKLK